MAARSLLAEIRALGGINVRELRDLSGEGMTSKSGAQIGVFRKPTRGRLAGVKVAGFGLDELIPRLIEAGFAIRTDDVDGGAQDLRDMIQAELSGMEKIYPSGAAEEIWAREREERFAVDEPADSVRASQSGRRSRVRQVPAADSGPDIRALLELAIATRESMAGGNAA